MTPNPWALLPVAFLLFLAGSAMSFSDGFRKSPAFLPCYIVVTVAGGLLWVTAARLLDDKAKVYAYSLWWDGLMMFAYYLLPMLVMGVRPNVPTLCGVGLVVAGMLAVKIWS